MRTDRARRELVRGVALAASGELGAILAYVGHRRSLPHGDDRRMLRRILVDEIRHRRELVEILTGLGGRLDPVAERKLTRVGTAISLFCAVGGRFLPMVGAARLECDNIVEYELLARLAVLAGREDLVETFLRLGEVEWDHEHDLRVASARHPLWRVVSIGWPIPPPRATIRGRLAAWRLAPTSVRRRFSLLVR